MKRWGFKGGPRSHGSTKFHRKRGSIGSGRDRRPVKGTKMAGRMGCKWRELKGLKIWRINHKYNILYIQGPVIPGPTHCYVRIVDSCLPAHRELITKESHPPFPTFYVDDSKALSKLNEEEFDKDLHKFTDSTITFENFEVKKITKRDGAKLAKIKN
jgi:large subunit ribosomal protein L3